MGAAGYRLLKSPCSANERIFLFELLIAGVGGDDEIADMSVDRLTRSSISGC